MTSFRMKYLRHFLFVLLLTAVMLPAAGCSRINKIFDDGDDPPLPGDRLSVLQYQEELEPDPVLAATQMELPESWRNSFWPQAGGYPSHAMGHLTLDTPLVQKWSVSAGKTGKRNKPVLTQPVIADGRVFTIDAGARVSAFNAANGKKLWDRKIVPKNEENIGTAGGGLAFSDGHLYVTAGYRQILSLKPETGETIWKQETTSPTRSSPAVADGRVFVITLDNQVQAFAAEDGKFLWNYTGVVETTNLLGSSSPAVDRNTIVAALSSGEVLALRTENGQVLWQDNLASLKRYGALPGISDIRGMPVMDRGIIYVIGASGRMLALDENTGRRVWQKEIGGTETPWSAGDTVFTLTSDQQLVALSRHSGQIHWVTRLQTLLNEKDQTPAVWTGPVLAGERLILAGNTGHILLVNPYTGELTGRLKVKGGTIVPPVVADGMLYILSRDARLYAFGLSEK